MKSRESGRRKSDGPTRWPNTITHLVAGDRGDEAAHQDQGKVERALGGEKTGGEEERVARKEETEEEARLGENDQKQADRAKRDQELLGVEEHR